MSTDVFHLLDILGVHLYPSVFSRGSRNVQQAGPLLLAAIAIHMDVFHLLDILGVHLNPSVFDLGKNNVLQATAQLLAAIAIHMDVFHLLDILGAQRLNLAIDPLNPNAEKGMHG